MGSQRRGALYRAAQAIPGRRAPDGRPAGNLGWTGAGWLLCGEEETGERARAVSESSGGDAGRWAGVRERGAETGRCELDRRGSADARGPADSGRVRAERSARAEALAVGSGAQG